MRRRRPPQEHDGAMKKSITNGTPLRTRPGLLKASMPAEMSRARSPTATISAAA